MPSKRRSPLRLRSKTASRKRKGALPEPAGLKALLKWALRAVVLAAIWGGVLAGCLVAYYASDMPDIKNVTQAVRRPSITLLADDGSTLTRYGDLYGHYVTLNQVPKNLVHAIIAIEDRRFYSHFGVDLIGMMRAAVLDVWAGHVVQGGSTLTQQLAKNLFLSPERTFKRKVQEMLLALWLEHLYSKDQILTAYLNRVYLGAGAYGVDAAAETYFNKPVADLNLRECAILAGLLRAPSRFSPAHNPDEALARATTVLGAMIEEGYITAAEKTAALDQAPVPRRKPGTTSDAHYFSDWIIEQVSGLLQDTSQDLVVATTLDPNLQRAADRHVDAILAAAQDHNISQASLVTLAPDGAVRALVGGRDYDESQFNRVTQARRQPGSSFKPVIYLTALEQGMQPDDVFDDAPLSINGWSPENYEKTYRGPVTAREALAESINTVAVRVLQKAGIGNVIKTAEALGIASPLGHDLSLALGTSTMTPLEMTAAYASLAADGRAITPYAIKEIRNRDGQVLYRRATYNPPVTVNPQAVATLVDMMRGVITYGTGKKAALDRPAAGKTGTSSDYRDAWFLGFTADYTTGVWMGNDDDTPMKRVVGGSYPAQLWHDYMMDAEARLPVRELLGNPATTAGYGGAPRPEGSSSGGDLIGDLIHSIVGGPATVEPSYPAPEPGQH